MTREQLRAQLSDRQAIIATLYGEAAREPLIGKIAAACVIRNRVLADLHNDGKPDWWGETFAQVCLKAWQFSCWWEDNANSARVYALAEDLRLVRPTKDAEIVAELGWIADGVLGDAVRDVTAGSTHYLTRLLYNQAPPKWAANRSPTVQYGAHVFFSGVEA